MILIWFDTECGFWTWGLTGKDRQHLFAIAEQIEAKRKGWAE